MAEPPANLWDSRDDRDDRITREPVGDVGGYDGSERVGSVVDGLPDTTLSLPSQPPTSPTGNPVSVTAGIAAPGFPAPA